MKEERVELTIPSQLRYLPLVSSCVRGFCRWTLGLSGYEKAAYNVQLAVHEAATNIIEHAYGGVADGRVEFVLRSRGSCLEIEINDHGEGFDFNSIPSPSLIGPQERGYGIFLIKNLVDEVSYQSDPVAGNRLRLVKHFE
ncbi:MAG: ATP-binding protein [Chloroflexota bacterium]|nr:ATP-binding protein [Chloroflexota bacterium]